MIKRTTSLMNSMEIIDQPTASGLEVFGSSPAVLIPQHAQAAALNEECSEVSRGTYWRVECRSADRNDE